MADLFKQLEEGYRSGLISKNEYEYLKGALKSEAGSKSSAPSPSTPTPPPPTSVPKTKAAPSGGSTPTPTPTPQPRYVKMWTGNGYATVLESNVGKYEREKGWTTKLPTQAEVDWMIKNPATSAKIYDTSAGKYVDRPASPSQGQGTSSAPKTVSSTAAPGTPGAASAGAPSNQLAASLKQLEEGYKSGLISEKEYNYLKDALHEEYGARARTPTPAPAPAPAPTGQYDSIIADLQKQLQEAINAPTQSYEEIYESIMKQIPKEAQPEVLSWEDALKQAKENVNPIYDESQKNLSNLLDVSNIRSGFYGQKPGDAYKSERLSSEENARLQAINSLATQLQGLSRQDAQSVINTNLARQGQALQALQTAASMSGSQKNTQLQNLWNLVDLLRAERSESRGDEWREREWEREEDRYQDTQTWREREWLENMRRYADTIGWKEKEWDEYVKRYDDATSQQDREWVAYEPLREAQLKGLQIDNRLKEIELEYLPTKIKNELKNFQKELEAADSQSEYQSILNDYNLAIKAVELDTSIQKLEDMAKTSPNKQGMTYSEYLNYLLKMINETLTVTEFDEATGAPYTTTAPKYSWEDIKSIIQGLNVDPTWKNSLLNDTGSSIMYRNSKLTNTQ